MSEFPIAPIRPHPITQHGQTRVDDYFWMRDRSDPAVLEYINAENDYTVEMMQHTSELREQLFAELKGRIQEDDATVPEREGGYFYYSRYQSGKQYPLYCRKSALGEAAEEILLDQNEVGAGKEFCRMGAFAVSPNGRWLAYSIDWDGSEQCTLYFKNLETGEHSPETIAATYGNVYTNTGLAWANDNRTIFYVTRDAALRPYRLYRHTLGSDPAYDELVYEEPDEMFYLYLFRSRSGKFIKALSFATLSTEWRVLSADDSHGEFRVFAPRRPDIEYHIEHSGRHWFVRTNDAAENFRLLRASDDATSSEQWRELIPHRADVFIENVLAFENHLVLLAWQNGLRQLRVSAADAVSDVHYLPFPDADYDVTLADNPEFRTTTVRFSYSSLITPKSVID